MGSGRVREGKEAAGPTSLAFRFVANSASLSLSRAAGPAFALSLSLSCSRRPLPRPLSRTPFSLYIEFKMLPVLTFVSFFQTKKKNQGQTALDLHSPPPPSSRPSSSSSSQSVRSSLSRSTWSTASTSRRTRQKCSCGGGLEAASAGGAAAPLPLVSAAVAVAGVSAAAATVAAGPETSFPPPPSPPPPRAPLSVPGAGLECHSLAPGLSRSHADSRSRAARSSSAAARAPITASVPERRNWDRASVKYQQASARGLSEACSTLAVLGVFFWFWRRRAWGRQGQRSFRDRRRRGRRRRRRKSSRRRLLSHLNRFCLSKRFFFMQLVYPINLVSEIASTSRNWLGQLATAAAIKNSFAIFACVIADDCSDRNPRASLAASSLFSLDISVPRSMTLIT